MPNEIGWDGVARRLDAIILLLLERDGADSTTKKIERLLNIGFSQSEVAQVIAKDTSYVTAVTTKKRHRTGGERK